MSELEGQAGLFGQDSSSGKMSPSHSAAPAGRISAPSWRRSSELKYVTLMSLDLTPGAGDLLGRSCWEDSSPWRGGAWMRNSGVSPREERGCSLSQILLEHVPRKYYLSRRACWGILRRARERGKPLPPQLELALLEKPDELRSVLERVKGEWELSLTAGFCAGAGSSAGSIGYQEELSPTLKASQSGNMMPSILCLNDQGGQRLDCSENVTGTLRSQEHGHPPLLLYENHGIAARYRGPLSVAPTLTARAGTGGLNTPLVSVFRQQRADRYVESGIASTESARQYKSATDLILQPEDSGTNEPAYLLIRRLHPTEAERLQGFPSGWTDLPGASDSARFQALGNSVPIPCVEYIMAGIALALGEERNHHSSFPDVSPKEII